MNAPPDQLGQFQIIREIARSNDVVYEAFDPVMNRRVAVKELNVPAGMTDAQRADRVARFRREAQAAGTLNHPNIMTVFTFAEDGGRLFMALEFLDGETLRGLVDREGALPRERAVEIATALLEGLGHAHANGVVHRDMKPDNVQITSAGGIKITDFGIARLTFQPNLTMDGQVFGTPSYMSPEQVVGRDIDARSDLFSVAVLLYEMVAGRKPFPGDSVVAITYGIVNTAPIRPDGIGNALWGVLERGLDKVPSGRFQTAGEFVRALRDAEKADAAPSAPVQAPPVQPNPYGAAAAVPPPSVFDPYSPQATQQAPVYNYTQQPYGQVAPGHTIPPPPGGIPAFYPPPPRPPIMLLKPETKAFLRRLVTTILVVGTLFVLVIVVVNALVNLISGQEAERMDKKVMDRVAAAPSARKLEAIERALREARSAEARAALRKQASEIRRGQGDASVLAGDLASAEVQYDAGQQSDPTNPDNLERKAYALASRAASEKEPRLRAELYKEAAKLYRDAAQVAPDAERKATMREYAAQMGVSYAQSVIDARDTASYGLARQEAQLSLGDAAPGSTVYQQAQSILAELR